MSNREILEDIERYERDISISKSYNRLIKDKDFIKVIEEGYLDKYLKDMLLASTNYSKDSSIDYLEEVKAIGYLRKYLNNIRSKESIAIRSIEEAREELIKSDRED